MLPVMIGSETTHRHSRRWAALLSIVAAASVLAQTLGVAAPAGASPPAPAHPSAPVAASHRSSSPLVADIAHQIRLHQGSAGASDIPKAALVAATGPAPRAQFAISPAVHRLLTAGLGLEIGPSLLLTGGVYRHYIAVPVGAPRAVSFGLPAGYPTPVFARGVLAIDESNGTLTYFASTASGLGASLSIAVPRAATTALNSARDLSGAFEIPRLPVLGGQVGLKGTVSYTAGTVQVSASSYDTAASRLDGGRVSVGPDLRVTLGTDRGLAVAGRATVGGGRQALPLALAGTVASATDWSLALTPAAGAAPWQPIAGLVAAPDFAGTLTDRAGAVRFEVASSRPVSWAPTAVTSESVTRLVYSDAAPPAGTSLPATYRPGDAWIGTSGRFAVSAGAAGTLQAAGQLGVDLSAGQVAVAAVAAGTGLAGLSATPLTASIAGQRRPVADAALSGALTLRDSRLEGTLVITTPHNGSLRVSGAALSGALTAPAAAPAPQRGPGVS